MSRKLRVLSMGLAMAALLPALPASAHAPLPANDYGCMNPEKTQLVNRTLQIKPGREYVFRKSNGDRVGNPGEFAHPSDPTKIRFTSGYLANNGWRGTHSSTDLGDYTLHTVTLKKYVDGEVVNHIKCEPQSGP